MRIRFVVASVVKIAPPYVALLPLNALFVITTSTWVSAYRPPPLADAFPLIVL